MAHNTAPDNPQLTVENLNAEQLQKADVIWNQTVDSCEDQAALQVIEHEETSLKALQTHMQEMTATLEALETLPDKVSHDVMVPFGCVAMFPGKLVHTNEVHMKLSPTVAIHTSTKHAAQVLERRKTWVQEQQTLVQEQLDAMRARKDFAVQEKEDDGDAIRDIVEIYDEDLHGALDTPAVRAEVHKQRQYFGPPRNAEEQAAHDHALQEARNLASQVTEEEATSPTDTTAVQKSRTKPSMEHANKRVAEEQPQQPLAGRAVYQAGAGDADSDDDDETAGQQQPPPARAALPPSSGDSVSGEAMFPDESALNEEVERLMMALQGTSTTETAAVPETSAPRPLIEEVQAPVAASQAVTPPHAEGNTLEAAAVQPSQHAVGSLAGSEPGTSKPSSTGLKGGFFNRNAKPKKGILKNTEPPPPISEVTDANGETHTNLAPQRPSCPTVARQLVQQDDQSDTRQAAFSGFVRERDQPVQDAKETKVSDETKAQPARVSKFKARMAAERENRNT